MVFAFLCFCLVFVHVTHNQAQATSTSEINTTQSSDMAFINQP